MAIKPQLDNLDGVPAPLREHYVLKDGKYVLQYDGDPPGYVRSEKLAEFRDTNVKQARELDELRPLKTKFEGIDPDIARAALASVGKVTTLEAQLAAEKTARATAQAQVDASVLKSTITEAFLKAGGRPKALGFILGQATPVFTVENGALKTAQFSVDKPGEPLSVDEFILMQTKESDFAFAPSSGGGAIGGADKGRIGARTNQKELVDPTPQELGQHAAAIRRGDIKVVSSSD